MKTRFAVALLAAASVGLSGCGVLKGKDRAATPTLGNRVPILGSTAGLEVDATTAGRQVILPIATTNAEWTQPGGNPAKFMGHLALGDSLSQAWTATIPGGSNRARLAAAPVVSGGTLFAMDTDGTVHAFDAANGGLKWRTRIGGADEGNVRARFGGGVSASGGVAYATNGLGDVAALDAATGAVRWTVRPGGPLRGAPTVAFGTIFVVSQDNQIFAINASDGQVQWQKVGNMAPGTIFGAAAPAIDRSTVVAGYSSGELNAYRFENGNELWFDALARTAAAATVSTLADIDADPVIANDRVFAIGQGGRMAAYELMNGQRVWELSMGGISTPWVAGEWVFVVGDDARVFCISGATGKIRWIGQLPRWRNEEDRTGPIRWTGPVLAGGRLLLTSTDGRLAQINPLDGSITSTSEISGPSRQGIVVANGTMYILDDDGRITAWR